MKKVFATITIGCLIAVVASLAQLPKPGSGGGSGDGGTAGTDFAKPSLYDTYANVAAATCSSAESGRVAFTSNSIYTARCNGTAWQWAYRGQAATPPPSTGWTWDNQNSGTINSANGFEYLSAPKSGAVNLSGRYRTAPSTPYTVKFLLTINRSGAPPGASGTNTNNGVLLGFRDGDGKIVGIREFVDGSGFAWSSDKWTSTISFSAVYVAYQSASGTVLTDNNSRDEKWFAISDDGTNLKYYWSIDGLHWKLFDTRARGDFLTTGPNAYGYFVYANGDAVDIAIVSLTESASATP